jgi:error-prone DNA polymerase
LDRGGRGEEVSLALGQDAHVERPAPKRLLETLDAVAAVFEAEDGLIVTVSGLVLVRQRPGTASGVIFMTLEDETGIANIVVWPKMFEQFRPQVLGARLAAVRGKLQSESNVIHVIADHIEDLTPLLSDLHTDTSALEPASRADEVKRPVPDSGSSPGARRANLHKHPRNVRPLQPVLDYDATVATKVHAVLPKGRNFH